MAIPKKATSKKPVKAAKKSPRPSKGSNVTAKDVKAATVAINKQLASKPMKDVIDPGLVSLDDIRNAHTPIKLPVKFEPVMGTSFPVYYPFKRSASGMVYINLSMITRVDTCPSNPELVQIGLQGQTTQLVMATLSEVMSIIGAKY